MRTIVVLASLSLLGCGSSDGAGSSGDTLSLDGTWKTDVFNVDTSTNRRVTITFNSVGGEIVSRNQASDAIPFSDTVITFTYVNQTMTSELKPLNLVVSKVTYTPLDFIPVLIWNLREPLPCGSRVTENQALDISDCADSGLNVPLRGQTIYDVGKVVSGSLMLGTTGDWPAVVAEGLRPTTVNAKLTYKRQ